ncbi:MAG: lamin tail domain-containing protein, partial [Nocardioidaceae bacterium]
MITKKSRRAVRLAVPAAFAALLASPLTPLSTASAATGDHVVINESYAAGGSGGAPFNRKFVELYNPTDAAVDLSGMSLQYRSATGTSDSTSVAALTGSIEAGGYYLISGGSNGDTGGDLPGADVAAPGLNASSHSGTIALVRSTDAVTLPVGSSVDDPQVVDLLGYGSSNTFETTAAIELGGTSDQRSLNRTDGTDTDVNADDFDGSESVTPTNAAGETDTGGGDDGGGDPGPATEHTIAQIQGTTDTTPYAHDNVTTTGVVTATYPTGGYDGFYIQTAGTGGDINLATHDASNAIFVYGSAAVDAIDKVRIGDAVEVTGIADEFEGLTELTPASADDIVAITDPSQTIKPATVAYPPEVAQRESLEGMLIDPQGDYTISDNYDTNSYGSFVLAAGTTPLVQPTEVADAQDEAAVQAVKDDNAARAVTLDDGASTDFSTYTSNTDIALPYLGKGVQARTGAAVDFIKPVILDYRHYTWAFEPTQRLTGDNADEVQPATFEKTRTAAPEDVGGDVRLASFNVLNYFTTTGEEW